MVYTRLRGEHDNKDVAEQVRSVGMTKDEIIDVLIKDIIYACNRDYDLSLRLANMAKELGEERIGRLWEEACRELEEGGDED